MRATLLTLAALAAVLGGCRQKQASGAIPRQRFVLANVEVRAIPDTAPKGDSLRRAALRKHHVSEADLRRFVDVHSRSPEYLAAVWREVADSVQKRYDRSFPSRAEREAGGPVGPGSIPRPPAGIPGTPLPQNVPPVVRRRPVPPPNQPPPPVTEPPRPMVHGMPPVRRPPAGGPPDTHGPVTRPGQRPIVPLDTLERRRR